MSQSRFMEILKTVGETVLQVAPGLSKAPSEIGAQLDRMAQLGSSEIANGLYHGHGFVLYGPNQRPGNPERTIDTASIEPRSFEPPERDLGRSM